MLFIICAERKKRRQKEVKGSLLAAMPQQDEQQIIHDLFVSSIDLKNPTLNKRVLPPGSVWMSDTQQANIIFSHPEVILLILNCVALCKHSYTYTRFSELIFICLVPFMYGALFLSSHGALLLHCIPHIFDMVVTILS